MIQIALHFWRGVHKLRVAGQFVDRLIDLLVNGSLMIKSALKVPEPLQVQAHSCGNGTSIIKITMLLLRFALVRDDIGTLPFSVA